MNQGKATEPDQGRIEREMIMSLRTVNRTVKQIKDVSIEQMVDVERKTGEEFPRAGVVMIAVINDKRHMIGSIDSVESAEAEIAYWSQYDNPGARC